MDPRIGWCQEESMCSAYETWNSILKNAEIFKNLSQNGDSVELQNHHNSSFLGLNKRNSQQTNSLLFQNKASTCNLNLNLNKAAFLQEPSSKPWLPADFKYDSGYAGLHEEILLFNKYISSTAEECLMRNEVISKIEKLIRRELPNTQVNVFGSYKTELFLPTSDIDIVVFGHWEHMSEYPLNHLKKAIIREQISDKDSILVLDKALVPIIKIVDIKTELKIDISFNTTNSLNSVEKIKQFIKEFPSLRPLVMVLKQFLLQRDYNEVFRGGISSYSLILMTINFLQLHERVISANENLGILLIEFFELYGKRFNYEKSAIRIKDGGRYVAKDEIRRQFKYSHNSILCIEDPLDLHNDIGKSSFGALQVKEAFQYAYLTLSNAVLPHNSYLLKNNPSILGRIIRITREVIDYRRKIMSMYSINNEIRQTNKSALSEATNKKVDTFIDKSKEKSSNYLFSNNNDLNNNVNNNDNNNNNKNLLSLSSCLAKFL
jgi:non-canonical poly(A) RNA polymerase PAPD5/7